MLGTMMWTEGHLGSFGAILTRPGAGVNLASLNARGNLVWPTKQGRTRHANCRAEPGYGTWDPGCTEGGTQTYT